MHAACTGHGEEVRSRPWCLWHAMRSTLCTSCAVPVVGSGCQHVEPCEARRSVLLMTCESFLYAVRFSGVEGAWYGI